VAKRTSKTTKANGAANLGFEATLWPAANTLRNNMDAAEYEHIVNEEGACRRGMIAAETEGRYG
jgi:hypothetical protein